MGKNVRYEEVEYNGHRYRRYPDSAHVSARNYFRRVVSLHVQVWEDAYGPVPPGHDIHHKDEDPGNNALDNLECLPEGDHALRHLPRLLKRVRSRQHREHLAQIQPLATAWHHSDEGLAWHRDRGMNGGGEREPYEVICRQCEQPFTSARRGRPPVFCCNACKAAARRGSGADSETRTCAWCEGEFTVNRYSRTTHCSRSCGMKHARSGG